MEFRLLGPLEALSDGRPLPIGGQKQRGVLALLLLHANEVVSTDRLIDEVWGTRPPKSVDASLQNCISHLRSVVGRDTIETRPPGYRLNTDPESVDALRFERALEAARALDAPERAAALREALALWRGPPLADVEFGGYAGTEVARIEELRLSALEERIDAELALGRHDVIIGEIEALAVRHPVRERLRRQLMLALYRAGRQRDALRVYQEARLELVEEFGLEPSEDLRALERMIITRDPALELEAPREGSRDGLRRNAVVALLELVDRDDAGSRDEAAAALAEIAVVVGRHEGEVRQLIAEELVAVFGSPVAHDDDTLRALRAVVEARAALPERFAVRAAVERVAGDSDEAAQLEAVSRLLAHAGTGELLLGPEALRVVPAAVDVVPHESGSGYRVLRFDPGAESFARHLDAPIVGRLAELERLDAALAEAERSRAARRVVLVGEPGIGKTRLAEAFVSRVGPRARALAGRCRAYGDGAGLLPLRDILQQLEPLDETLAGEPDAARVIAPLRERALTQPSDAFWAFRRLLEVSAGEGPLIVLLEDLHWAAPDLLDLVEYLLGWAAGPILLLCVTRPELLDSRPDWRDDAVVLGAISRDEARTLAERLPERAGLPDSVVDAAIATAEGNPLFLEQLVVFAADDALDSLPPTLEVSIAARIDRLPAAERAVLERAAVVGRHFWRSTIEETSPDEERAVGSALIALARRRLVHAERATLPGEDGFRFHHALIRDAVYAGIAESSRAELHEAVARVLPAHGEDRDEIVGYHLEQAALLRAARGEPAGALASEARSRLGAAGIRAMKRVDPRAAIDLLTRALALAGDEQRELECALGLAHKFSGQTARAEQLLEDLARRSATAGDARIEHLARIELVWPRLARGELTLDEVDDLLDQSLAIFEPTDDFARGRAWHCRAVVETVYRFHHLEDPVNRLKTHYERSGFARGSALFLLAAVAYRGRMPAKEGIERCHALLDRAGTPFWQSFILPMLAVLEAMDSRLDLARVHLDEARLARQEFPEGGPLATSWAALVAEVELLGGDLERAEGVLTAACEELRAAGEREWRATNTAILAEVFYRQGRLPEALARSGDALALAPPGHLTSLAVALRVRAKALAGVGELGEAASIAASLVDRLEHTEVLDEQGEAFAALAEVHALAGRVAAADAAWGLARTFFERKGNVVSAARIRARSTTLA